MKSKCSIVAALGVAILFLSGCCQTSQKTQSFAPPAADLKTSATLFGPTPLPLGFEDRGYFATTIVAGEAPLLMLEPRTTSYVSTEIWDYENNSTPFANQNVMWRHSVKEGPSNP